MLVKHNTATSISDDNGEEIHGKDGIFEVPVELGERLIRIFGFRPHDGAAPEAGTPAKAAAKPRAKRGSKKTTEPLADTTSDAGAAPDEDAPEK